MPFKLPSLCLVVLLSCAAVAHADQFSLDRASVPRAVSGRPGEFQMFVTTSGDAPNIADIVNRNNWLVTAQATKGAPFAVDLVETVWTPAPNGSGVVTLTLHGAAIRDPQALAWQVLFVGDHLNLVTGPKKPEPTFTFADTKDDADIYVAGSFLAAQGSAPIWALDAKAVWLHELTEAKGSYGSWWDGGVNLVISANQDATPPVTHTVLAFDSIVLGAVFRNTRPTHAEPYAWLIDLPINGEFSKDSGAADLVAGIHVKAALRPQHGAFAFYPWAGYDAGVPVKKPDTIEDQPADLSNWTAVSRVLAGAVAEFYLFKPDLTADDPSRLTVDFAATARKPLVPEPYVDVELVNGASAAVTHVDTRVRPDIELTIAWNITDLLGAQVQYQYGAVPPLYTFGNQVTVGLTFKTKYSKSPYVKLF